jgi:hypothetical protein
VGKLEHLRVIAPQLLAHAVGQTIALVLQVVGDPRPLAQLGKGGLVPTGRPGPASLKAGRFTTALRVQGGVRGLLAQRRQFHPERSAARSVRNSQ